MQIKIQLYQLVIFYWLYAMYRTRECENNILGMQYNSVFMRLFIIGRNFFLEKQNFLRLNFEVQIFLFQFSIFSSRLSRWSIVNAIFLRSTII